MRASSLLITGLLLIFGFNVWADSQMDPLKVGIFPRFNRNTAYRSFEPLTNYLTEKLHRPVELQTYSKFNSFWEALSRKEFDLVHFNQYHYVRSHLDQGYQAILVNEEFGENTIQSTILTHIDSDIKKISDLKGKKVLFGGGEQAMVSYILSKYLLKQQGLHQLSYQTEIAINPPNALLAAYSQSVSASGVGKILLKLPFIKRELDTAKIRVLATSKAIPQLTWAVHAELNTNLKKEIIQNLLHLKDTRNGVDILKRAGLSGFSTIKDDDFNRVREIIADVLNEHY